MGEFQEMYRTIKLTREVLFEYCASLPLEVYIAEHPGVSHGSIRNTHLHVANNYHGWIGHFALSEDDNVVSFTSLKPRDYSNLEAVRAAFAAVDAMVEEFLTRYSQTMMSTLRRRVSWMPEPFSATPLWIFTDLITHEFHHKGQIVILGRDAGYPPPQTDLILP
jgi:uncharacterized damage-inducible protein DinB